MKIYWEELLPTSKKIVEALHDGKPHTRDELMQLLPDPEFAKGTNLTNHIMIIRKVIRKHGEDILCVLRYKKIHYQHVRLLSSYNSE